MKWGEGDFSVRGFLRVVRWWVPIWIAVILAVTFLDSRAASMTFGNRLSFAVGLSVLMAPLVWLRWIGDDIGRGRAAGYMVAYFCVMVVITAVALLLIAIVKV